MKIKSVQKGQDYLGFLFIKSQMTKTATNGSRYFNMVLNDADFDEIDGKKWDVKPEDEEIFTNGKLVKIKGKVQEFNNRLQLIVEKMRLVDESDEVNINDFIETVPVDIDEMLGYINDTIDDFTNADIAAITKKIFGDQVAVLSYFPAAKKHHHAIKGGLLYHTYSMLRIGKGLVGIYPFINRDLLYAGIILHDIGKINEMVSDENGSVSDYTPEGKLLGHITQEIVELELVGQSLGTDPEVLMMLKHMILSHHYQPEFGSPKRPMFPEAELLHHIDMIDARMYTMEQALNRVEPGSFTEANWSLDGISLYRPSFEQEQPMSLVYQEKKRVACYESDSTERMLPTTAMNYFQEASTNQGHELGLGGDYLKDNNLAWFLVKYVIRFNDYPCYQDEVTVTTRATGMEKFCATRRFIIEDETGLAKVVADTQWLLINRETEKMERIDAHPEMDAYECFEKGEPLFKKMAKISRFDLEKSFSVRFLDIDFNQHVNHVKYLAWAIEILPLEVVKTRMLAEAKIVYKAQCFYGDQVRALGEQLAENHYRIDIVNQDEIILCQLELILR